MTKKAAYLTTSEGCMSKARQAKPGFARPGLPSYVRGNEAFAAANPELESMEFFTFLMEFEVKMDGF
jgi:hypothetical protein